MKNITEIFDGVAYEIPLPDGDLIYTTIIHSARKKLKLTCNAYCVADTIYHLSNNPSNKYGGWCYASKERIGEILDLSKQTVHKLINLLITEGLIEKHRQTRHLRTTKKWYLTVMVRRAQIVKKIDSS